MQNGYGESNNTLHYYDKIALNDEFTENGVRYYKANSANLTYNQIIGSNFAHNGFYNTYIRGQTMLFVVPPTPHTVLWCSGATL